MRLPIPSVSAGPTRLSFSPVRPEPSSQRVEIGTVANTIAGSTGEGSAGVSATSMTGFARADGEGLGISWVWEVKSVNGKSLDLRLRLVPGFDALEPQLRAMVAQRFRRGNFSANLAVTRIAPAAVRINRETLTQFLRLMNELAAEIEAAPPRLDGLLALRGVVETVEDEDDAVLDGWATALDRLALARAEEGGRVAALLQSQLQDLTALVAAAEGCAAAQ